MTAKPPVQTTMDDRMIGDSGWLQYNIWEHSRTVRELYARRCRLEAEEMTCAAQAAELLAERVQPGDTVLDVGCGSGYFFHSLRQRELPVEYIGIDGSPTLIQIGRQIMPSYGLAASNLRVIRIEDLSGLADHVVCLNVLSNIDNFHRPLDRLLRVAQKTVILRESIAEQANYQFVVDKYLESPDELKVHVNTYAREDIQRFVHGYGFELQFIEDRRTRGEPELVIDYPHYWKFLVATRRIERP